MNEPGQLSPTAEGSDKAAHTSQGLLQQQGLSAARRDCRDLRNAGTKREPLLVAQRREDNLQSSTMTVDKRKI